jgi:hypothetical protein
VWSALPAKMTDISGLAHFEAKHSADRRLLGMLSSPKSMRSFFIGFGRWSAFLPPDTYSPLYRPDELNNQRKGGKGIKFTGSAYEWPKAPTFGIDWSAPQTPPVDWTPIAFGLQNHGNRLRLGTRSAISFSFATPS